MVLRLLSTPPTQVDRSFAVELKGVPIVKRTPVRVIPSPPKPQEHKSFFQRILNTVRPEQPAPAPVPVPPRPSQPIAPKPVLGMNRTPTPAQPTPFTPAPAPSPVHATPVPAHPPTQPIGPPVTTVARNDGGGSSGGGSGGTTATGPGAGSGSGSGSGNTSVGGGGSGQPSGAGGGSGSGHGSGQGTGRGDGEGHGTEPAHEAPQPARPPEPRGESRAARILNQSKPGYPSDARDDGVEGTATLLVTVDESGHVSNARLERSAGDKRLDRAAEQAVRQWSYTPALKDGVPETATIRVRVQFRLE